MIIVDNVTAGYRTPRGLVKAVDRVSLEIRDGEILGIAGESGCGKTTLLKLLYGNFGDGLEIFSGRVQWRDPDGRRTIDCADFHRHWWEIFSYVPQGSMSALNPLMRIAPQMPAPTGRRGGRAWCRPWPSSISPSAPCGSIPISSRAACASAC